MFIQETINQLQIYNGPDKLTLHPGASEVLLQEVEQAYGITLPDDFKELYRFSDGFEAAEDMFNIIPLAEIIDNKSRHLGSTFAFAEYMIYCDSWQLEVNPQNSNDYAITVHAHDNNLVLTKSLAEFIARFFKGGVFGLYDWHDEVEQQPVYTTKLKTVAPLLTVFYHGLKYGFISKQEVVAFADQIIMHENEPEAIFIDISLSHDKNELISLLHDIPAVEGSIISRAILGLLYHRLSTGSISIDQAVFVMDKYNFYQCLTQFEMPDIYDFTDEFLIDRPLIEEVEFQQNVLNFLAYYKDFEILNFKHWTGFNSRIQYKFSEREKSEAEFLKNRSNGLSKSSNLIKEVNPKLLSGIVHILALTSLIIMAVNFTDIDNRALWPKFRSDLYQFAQLCFTTYIFYYVVKAIDWLFLKIKSAIKKG